MHVDPMRPRLKAPGYKRLKLEHEKRLSNVDFNFNLCRHTEAAGLASDDPRIVLGDQKIEDLGVSAKAVLGATFT